MKPMFEEMGGTYTQIGDFLFPNLCIENGEEFHIDKYGRMRNRCSFAVVSMKEPDIETRREKPTPAQTPGEAIKRRFPGCFYFNQYSCSSSI